MNVKGPIARGMGDKPVGGNTMRKTAFMIVFVILLCSFPLNLEAAKNQANTPSGIPYPELKHRVDDYAAKYIGSKTAGASVVIMKDGELIVNSSYGYLDLENQVEVTSDTVFEWGSATKLLVWTSVMQLVEQGKLDLEEDIQAYLPEGFLTKLHYDTPITMLNLMHHDAGWEDKYTDLFYLSAEEVKPLKDMLQITEPSQVHQPGEFVAYSNYGVALAGYIVERITGQPFYEYVNDNLFAILDMSDTAIHPSQEDNQAVAGKRDSIHGYLVNKKGEFSRSKNDRVYIGLYPAGSAIGTAEDAAKFIGALMPQEGEKSPLFQSNHTLHEMLTTSDTYGNGLPRNSHGFWEGMYTVDVLEHGGNTDSFSSNFTFSKEENLGVIVMTNQAGESGLSYGLPTLVYGEYPAAEEEKMLPSAHELEGSYGIARQPYEGFTKLMGFLMIDKLKVEDDSKFTALGMSFEQVAPYVYRSTNEYNLFLHFTMNDGEVAKVSMMTSDLMPTSFNQKLFMMISFLCAVACALSIIISLLITLIGRIRNRKNAIQYTTLKKWTVLLDLAGGIAIVNFVLLAVRTIEYVSYASLAIHFWIFYAYIALVAVSVCVISGKWKMATGTRIQKIGIILSCLTALVLTTLIIAWDLYK